MTLIFIDFGKPLWITPEYGFIQVAGIETRADRQCDHCLDGLVCRLL